MVANYSERTVEIAGIIERYVKDHPRAADTLEGIRGWWVTGERHGDSLEDVEAALDYLVQSGRLSRIMLPDGAVIYTRAARSH
jgi:hypothetical protein